MARLKTLELVDITMTITDQETKAVYDLLLNSSSESISINDPLELVVVVGGEKLDQGTLVEQGRSTEFTVEFTSKSIDEDIVPFLKSQFDLKKRIDLSIEGTTRNQGKTMKYNFLNGAVKKRPIQTSIAAEGIDGAYTLSFGFPPNELSINYKVLGE